MDAPMLADRYVLGDLLGRGGMADVYRATDRVLGRSVAVKLLRDVAATPAERERFTAEARMLARLSHPALVTVLDAGTEGERPYLVMQLVDGPSLAECCAGVALALSRVAAIGRQVADALAYAHAADVVHRDVKPGNVLLGRDGRVWLADFGIARLVGDTAHLTRTGLTLGSPAYLSPEQVRGTEVTPAADVYSLGLVLLEALTGRRAYEGNPTEAALARLSTPPAVPADLDEGWRALLSSMTALEPGDRPSARDVAASVRRLESGEVPDPASTQVLPTVEPTSTRHSVASRRRWLALVGALALVVGVLMAVLLGGRPEGGGGEELPDGVPPTLQEPLRDLHDAVEGEAP